MAAAVPSTNIANATSKGNSSLVGWMDENSGRGTLSVLTSCLFTTFLCTWTVIHARVTRNSRDRIFHKTIIFVKSIIAPELIAVEGYQEWSQAQRLVRECRECTDGGFTMIHAFYIGMLGLRYRTREGERVIWPNQMCWLLQQNLLRWDDHALWGLSREVIEDKGNADTTVKFFALVQVSWFVAQSIMRVAHQLPLSQLETMTLSYIPLYAVTYFFWWVKPKDILVPSVIDLPKMSTDQQATFEQMCIDSGFDVEGSDKKIPLATAWKLTPRIFEKRARDKAERNQMTAGKPQPIIGQSQKVSFDKKLERAVSNDGISPTTKAHGMDGQIHEAEDFNILPGPLRVHYTVPASLQNPSTLVLPKRRAMTTQTAEDMTEIQRVKISFTTRTLLRAATGYWTAQSRIGTLTPAEEDRIIPLRSNERVVAYWDPDLYYSKLWPVTCLFGVSFPALHLIGWHSAFPTFIELWLWRASAIASIVSMLIFMQYEKVVLKWGGPLVLLSIASPVVYLLSRVVMIAQAFASFRAMDVKVYDTYEVIGGRCSISEISRSKSTS